MVLNMSAVFTEYIILHEGKAVTQHCGPYLFIIFTLGEL